MGKTVAIYVVKCVDCPKETLGRCKPQRSCSVATVLPNEELLKIPGAAIFFGQPSLPFGFSVEPIRPDSLDKGCVSVREFLANDRRELLILVDKGADESVSWAAAWRDLAMGLSPQTEVRILLLSDFDASRFAG